MHKSYFCKQLKTAGTFWGSCIEGNDMINADTVRRQQSKQSKYYSLALEGIKSTKYLWNISFLLHKWLIFFLIGQ